VTIWVDADACPNLIREILFKAVQVPQGFDVADDEIAQRVQKDDLVITGDIPLAAEVMEKGAHALNPRGERYDPDRR